MVTTTVRATYRTLALLLTCVALALGAAGVASAQEDEGGLIDTLTDIATKPCDTAGQLIEDAGAGMLAGKVLEHGCRGTPVGAVETGQDVAEAGAGAAGEVAESAVGGVFDKIVQNAASSFGQMVIWSATLWMKFPTTSITQESLFARLQENTMWIQVVLLTASLMIAGGRMALARSTASSLEEAENALKTGARSVLAATLLSGVVITGGKAGDALAQWFVDEAMNNGDPLPILEKMTTVAAMTGPAGIHQGSMAILLLSILGILTSLIQVVFIVVRNMLLVLVVAFVPLAAASSGATVGRQSYDKLVGFIVALLLFKPVAALVLAIALWTGQSEDTGEQFIGLMLLVLGVLVLPTLIKLIVPAVSAAGMGPSALAVGGAAAAVGAKAGMAVASGGASAAGGAGAAGGGAGAGGMGSAPGPNAGSGSQPSSPPSFGGAAGGIGGGGGGMGSGGGGGTQGGENRGGGQPGGFGGAAVGGAGGSENRGGGNGPVAGEGNTFTGHVNPTPERGIGRHEVDQ